MTAPANVPDFPTDAPSWVEVAMEAAGLGVAYLGVGALWSVWSLFTPEWVEFFEGDATTLLIRYGAIDFVGGGA